VDIDQYYARIKALTAQAHDLREKCAKIEATYNTLAKDNPERIIIKHQLTQLETEHLRVIQERDTLNILIHDYEMTVHYVINTLLTVLTVGLVVLGVILLIVEVNKLLEM